MKPLPAECERRALASETWTKWSASSRSKARFFRGAKGDYGWFQRKDARTQRAVANDSLRPGVFALIFVLYLKPGTECGTMVAEK